MGSRNWSREELMLAFNLYCKTPFGKIHIHNPDVIELSKIINRTPSAVSWKLANFARLDPTLKKRNISGASHGSKMDIEIWNEFNNDWERLGFESEELLAKKVGKPIESILDDFDAQFKEGKDRAVFVKARVNQSFFRKTVLAAYDFRCCITGLGLVELLNASHIVPWSKNATHRTNPRNGLCLNAIHDRAFDRGLITITTELQVKVSQAIQEKNFDNGIQDFFIKFDGLQIRLPTRFIPDKEFLEYHNYNVFRG